MNCKIRKNDIVYVKSGRDRGVRGRVLAVYPQQGRVLVEHVNMVKKHRKARKQQDERGIVSQEATIDISNVMCIDETTDKPTRVKMQVDEKGVKERVSTAGNPILVSRQ